MKIKTPSSLRGKSTGGIYNFLEHLQLKKLKIRNANLDPVGYAKFSKTVRALSDLF